VREALTVPDIFYEIKREWGEEIGVWVRGRQHTIGRRILPSM